MSSFWMANCTFISPTTLERPSELDGLALHVGDNVRLQRVRRQRAGRVARMHARLLDMLHHPANEHVLAVGERVDIHLDGVAEIGIDQHRALARHHHGLGDVAGELRLVVHDLHGAAAEHIRRADHHRETDRGGDGLGLRGRAGDAVPRLPDARAARSAP